MYVYINTAYQHRLSLCRLCLESIYLTSKQSSGFTILVKYTPWKWNTSDFFFFQVCLRGYLAMDLRNNLHVRPFICRLWQLSVGLSAAVEQGVIAKGSLAPQVLLRWHQVRRSGRRKPIWKQEVLTQEPRHLVSSYLSYRHLFFWCPGGERATAPAFWSEWPALCKSAHLTGKTFTVSLWVGRFLGVLGLPPSLHLVLLPSTWALCFTAVL